MTSCAAWSGSRRHASDTYDPDGNLTQKTEGTDTWGYEWNAHNELTRVTKNTMEQARFSYDPLGRRVEKVAGGVTNSYTYQGESILRESRGTSTFKYLHDPWDIAANEWGASCPAQQSCESRCANTQRTFRATKP